MADVSIFTIAFGIEDEAYYDFLRALSLENSGKAERFYPSSNSEKGMSDFYETISTPLITNMEFTYDDQVTAVVNTGEKNLFAGSDAILLGRYEPGTDMVSCDIKTTTRTGKRDFSSQFIVVPKEENNFIPRLWAYTTITDLLDRIEVEGEREELVSAVTDLSLEFGFVTPYTSLFVELPEVTSTGSVEEMIPEDVVEEETEVVDVVLPVEEVVEEVVEEEVVYEEEEPVTEAVVGYEAEEAEEEAEVPAEAPGFEAMYSIAGMLAVAGLLLRRRN